MRRRQGARQCARPSGAIPGDWVRAKGQRRADAAAGRHPSPERESEPGAFPHTPSCSRPPSAHGPNVALRSWPQLALSLAALPRGSCHGIPAVADVARAHHRRRTSVVAAGAMR